jgi:hypothetical protein
MSNYISYRELSAPAAEPVTLAQAKAQLVVDTTDDDALISALITAARQYCEKQMQRAIFNRSIVMAYDFFPYPSLHGSIGINDRHTLYGLYWRQFALKLAYPACESVESITYTDLSGNTQTVGSSLYYVDTFSEPARIVPNPGLYWPYTQSYLPGSVQITYTAGTWGDGVEVNNCPQAICQAILLLVGYWYRQRDAATTNPDKANAFSVDNLLSPYKFDTFGFAD